MTEVSSPLSTGGAGTLFEQHVGAMFLALLLTRGIPAVFQDCQVDKVIFQTRQRGWETDDLLVTCSSPNGRRRFAMQIRRSFTVGITKECKETIRRFWNDFDAQDRFDPDRDALVLVTLHHTENLGGLASLLNCARSSPDPCDFKDRLETSRFVSGAARKRHQEIRSIVDNMDHSGSINEDRFWRFLRTMHVLFLDFTTDTAQQEATVTQWLALSSVAANALDAAKSTWHELVALAADAASSAKTFGYLNLPGDMRERYKAIPDPMLQSLTDHSATILKGIRSTIGGTTTLPRTEVTAEAVTALGDRVVALTGPPGSGKSALAKAIIGRHSGNHLCLSFRATEFAKSHIDDVLLGSISGERFRLFVGAQERVLIYVDGLEHLLECPVCNAFNDLVMIVESCPNVSLMLTCRDNDTEKAMAALFDRSSLSYRKVMVPLLNAAEMELVCREIPDLETPLSRPELVQIMGTLYVLDMAARMDWSDLQNIPASIMAFRKKWWSEIVRNDGETTDGMPDLRESTLVDLAMLQARELRPSVPTDGMDKVALDKLRKDGVVMVGDGGLAAPAHDMIEDWAVIHWIESRAARHEWMDLSMASDIGTHPAVRRRFREWLKEGLDANAEKVDRFVLSSYDNNSLPEHFLDDVLVSLLTSNSARKFITRQKGQILADNARLLVKLIRLTRVACTKAPESSDGQTVPTSILMIPDGEAWPALLEITANELGNDLLFEHKELILTMLEDWTRGVSTDNPTPDGAASFGQIAYALLEHLEENYDSVLRKRVRRTILQVPRANKAKFVNMVKQSSGSSERLYNSPDEFAKLLIDHTDGASACRDFPEEVAQFIRSLCCLSEQYAGQASEFGTSDDDPRFGLHVGISMHFLPNSAAQGPFLNLLRYHQEIGIQLILDLVNHAGTRYGTHMWSTDESESIPRIKIVVPGHGEVEQWADYRLWLAYRGIQTAPYVLKCALMALECFLLDMCKNFSFVEPLLLRILRESNNVMTTAVVASVCNAYPDRSGVTALVLLASWECIILDRWRIIKEPEIPLYVISRLNPMDRYYNDERRKSNALPHRRHDLEALAVRLQSGEKKEQVWEIIDGHRASIPDKHRTDEDRIQLLRSYWMDIRCLTPTDTTRFLGRVSTENQNGEKITLFLDTSKMDTDILDFVNANAERNPQSVMLSLLNWGWKQWRQNSGSEDLESWRQVLAAARDSHQHDTVSGFDHILRQGPPLVAAVCVRDHWDDMGEDDRQWCTDVLVFEVERDSNGHCLETHMSVDSGGAGPAAFVLPSILARDPENRRIRKAVIRAITHVSAEVPTKAVEGVAEYLEPQHRDLMLLCAGAVAMLSNHLTRYEQQHAQGVRQTESDENYDTQNLLERVIGAVVDGRINTENEIVELDIGSRYGKNAVWRIMPMLGRAQDLPLARDFFVRVGQMVVDSWITERENPGIYADSQFWDSMTNRLVDVLLALPPSEIQHYCKPFLDAVDEHHKEMVWFVETLVLRGSMAPTETSFWDVWRAFAGRIANTSRSSDMRTHDSTDAALVDKILFNIDWIDSSRRQSFLIGHEDDVNNFVTHLPASPPVLKSYARHLYNMGESALPGALKVVAGHLQAGVTLDEGAASYLAATLQRYVYGRPQSMKADPVLRTSTLTILDRLVDAGSSAAYRMRDDFTTPNAD